MHDQDIISVSKGCRVLVDWVRSRQPHLWLSEQGLWPKCIWKCVVFCCNSPLVRWPPGKCLNTAAIVLHCIHNLVVKSLNLLLIVAPKCRRVLAYQINFSRLTLSIHLFLQYTSSYRETYSNIKPSPEELPFECLTRPWRAVGRPRHPHWEKEEPL